MANSGSHTHSTAGIRKMLTRAETRAPRASMVQMAPIRSMEDTKETPSVAAKSTRALVTTDASEESAAIWMASSRFFPARSSS